MRKKKTEEKLPRGMVKLHDGRVVSDGTVQEPFDRAAANKRVQEEAAAAAVAAAKPDPDPEPASASVSASAAPAPTPEPTPAASEPPENSEVK